MSRSRASRSSSSPAGSGTQPDEAGGEQHRREQGDGDIAVVGGIDTIRSMFLAGLIDTLTLTTHPVIASEGRRLFDDSIPLTRLRLLESNETSAGNAVLTYGLRPAD